MRARTFTRMAGLGGTLALMTIAGAVNIRDDVADQKYLDLANQEQFASVGQLIVSKSGAKSYGTATFIGFGKDQGWIVTATHVLSGYKDPSVFKIGDKEWALGDTYSYLGDLAVIPIKGIKKGDLTPVAFMGSPVEIPGDLSKRVTGTAVGFGKSGTGSKPGSVDDNKKRAYQGKIDSYKPKRVDKDGKPFQTFDGYLLDFDDGKASGNTMDATDNPTYMWEKGQKSSRDQEALEGAGDAGDSGGPLFVNPGKAWLLAGVYSGNFGGDGYGGKSEFLPFDNEYAKFVEGKTGIAPVPEPASMVGLALAIGAYAARRPRSRG